MLKMRPFFNFFPKKFGSFGFLSNFATWMGRGAKCCTILG